MKLIDCVKGVVKFSRFVNTDAKTELWYVCENGFEFPIPFEETKGAIWNSEDKAALFMRWIRPHLKLVESFMVE